MLSKTMRIIFIFYTFWGLVFHLLYFLWYIPNTWIIALFILVVSQIFLFVRPNYIKMYGLNLNAIIREAVFHRAPVRLVPMWFSRASLRFFLASLWLYLRVHGPGRVIELYKDKKNVVKEWLQGK